MNDGFQQRETNFEREKMRIF